MERLYGSDSSRAIRAGLFFGSLWGIAEATLGYALHLLPFVVPVVSLSGAIMFPVGFFFMYSAMRTSGAPISMLFTAVAAAGVKAATLALPGVSFLFVRNPIIAIVLEGSLCVAWARLLPSGSRYRRAFPAAMGLSVSWRALFVLVNLVLGIRGGILAKGAMDLLSFLLLESLVNAALIAALVSSSASDRAWPSVARPWFPRLAGACATGVVAIGVSAIMQVLP